MKFESYSGTAEQRVYAEKELAVAPRERTICTVIRHIDKTEKGRDIHELCLRATYAAKHANFILRQYNKLYDAKWWQRETYKPRKFTDVERTTTDKLLSARIEYAYGDMFNVFIDLFATCSRKSKDLCREGIWMADRMLKKIQEYKSKDL